MYHLAHANYAQWKKHIPPEHTQKFLDYAQAIHQSAAANPGLVWQNQAAFFGDPNVTQVFGSHQIIFNMSVWRSLEALKDFVYTKVHLEAIKDRDLWFDDLPTQVYVLWWVKSGHKPTVAEAKVKLDLLDEVGPSSEAFTFANPYQLEESKVIPLKTNPP